MGSTEQNDFEHELAFHRREWAIQRVGWVVLLLLIIAGLLGVFGHGPLSSARAGTEATGVIEYERFVRRFAPTSLRISAPQAAESARTQLEISREYLEAFQIEHIVPEPAEQSASDTSVRFQFDHSAASSTSITLHLQPEKIGTHRGSIKLDGRILKIQQFTYP